MDYAVKRSYMSMNNQDPTLMLGDPRTYQVGFAIKF